MCTSLIIKDINNNVYHGRTLELSQELEFFLQYIPSATVFASFAPDDTKAKSFTSKYPFLAVTSPLESGEHLALEGINTSGLSFSANAMQAIQPPVISVDEYKDALPLGSIGKWALAMFGTVDELKEAIKNQPVFFELENQKPAPALHFIFYDKTGKSIVVEYMHERINVYDNPTGVLTNSPEFPWHITNLNNYTQLTNIDSTTGRLGYLDLVQPDTGISTVALPCSDTAPGRFVRAVFYTTYTKIEDTPKKAILELSHIMNKFDRPKGMTFDPLTGLDEYTLWTSLTDLTKGIILIRTYNELGYTEYSLEEFTDKKDIVSIPFYP